MNRSFSQKIYVFVCVLFLLKSACYSQEIYDVETVPYLRTKEYPTPSRKKIVIFSAPRTGSSLVYNIFRFLFEEDAKLNEHHNSFNLDRVVLKTHRIGEIQLLEKENAICIFTFRNPFDACVSNFRICTRSFIDHKKFAQELVHRHSNALLFTEKLEKEGRHMIRLKYENFSDHLEALFEVIEDQFNIAIDSRDKELMRKSYSKENIEACVKNLKDFSEYLPISGFHGQHVTSQDYEPPADFLSWLNVYLENLIPLYQTYGYFNQN